MALTTKQQAFVNAYLANGFNATRAAIAAGYSERTAHAMGWENLRKPEIAEVVKQRMDEMVMTADEALTRLSDMAKADMSDFTSIKAGLPFIDLDKAEQAGKLHLLKEFRITDKGAEIKLYDAQSALVQIIKEQHLRAGEPTERSDVNLNAPTIYLPGVEAEDG